MKNLKSKISAKKSIPSKKGAKSSSSPKQQSKKKQNRKIKLDQGLKAFLRGIRRCLYELFEKFGLSDGYYKWSDDKFYESSHLFIKKLLNTKKSQTSEYVWIMVSLLYPKKAMVQGEMV